DRLDRVAEALTLVHAARADAEVHRVCAEPFGRRLEAHPSARAVLEEEADDGLATQGRHLRHRATIDLGHVIAEVEQRAQTVGADVTDREQMLHDSPRPRSWITTPSALTRTSSSRLLGRFLPTKSGRIGSSRWPRSISTANCTIRGRPYS